MVGKGIPGVAMLLGANLSATAMRLVVTNQGGCHPRRAKPPGSFSWQRAGGGSKGNDKQEETAVKENSSLTLYHMWPEQK